MSDDDFVFIQPVGHMFAATISNVSAVTAGRPPARVSDPRFSTVETALFWALEQRTALGPSVDPGCNWNPLAPIPVGETPDPPAAPVWYDADAAGSWQSGWVRGFTDAGGVRWAEQVDAMMRMIGEAAAAADERGSGTVAEVFEELAAQVRRQFPEVP